MKTAVGHETGTAQKVAAWSPKLSKAILLQIKTTSSLDIFRAHFKTHFSGLAFNQDNKMFVLSGFYYFICLHSVLSTVHVFHLHYILFHIFSLLFYVQ